MNELFGISMDLIMFVLLALLAVSLVSMAYVALRNPIMFKLGIRNIPRRRAQTTLIVLGLMLSTVIISAAFTTGDTIDRSVTSEVYRLLGSVDETIVVGDVDDDAFGDDETQLQAVRDESFDAATMRPLIEGLSRSENVDAVVPAYMNVAVAVNLTDRLSTPLFNLIGLDTQAAAGLSDLREVGGDVVHVSDLGSGEIFLNESAADDLDVQAGDVVALYTAAGNREFRVKAVVEDRRLAGTAGISTRREGGVVPLEVAQSFFNAPGQLTMIAVSNEGDTRAGLLLTEAVEEEINGYLAGLPTPPALSVQTVKRSGVDIAEEAANLFASFFLIMGLFSIGAGVLLIFMIFVMLAAERKSEMGMARAVGTKRTDIVQTFLSEGMAYNVLAAMVGTAIGVGVAFIISRAMASLFASSNLEISPYVTLRSLLISYSLGVVLTFLTVTFSSWRVSLINIVRAIRDIPEPPAPRPSWGTRGFLPTLRDLFFRPTNRAGWLRRGAGLVAVVLAGFSASVPALLFVSLLIAAGILLSYAISQEMPWLLRIGVFLGTLLVLPVSIVAAVFMTFQLGPLFLLGSLPLIALGAAEHSAFPLLFGLSLAPLGLALLIRSFGANERLTYTVTGLLLIYIWEIDFSVGLLEAIFGEVQGDFEMFFLSGVMVTVAATFVIVYNADMILGPLTSLGRGYLGALLPSIKMAVAYPLANTMRTGMTMAMFCLVVFALTMISSFNHNFNRLFRSEGALGGWDITVDENPESPILDLNARLREANSPALSEIEAVGVSSIVSRRNARLCHLTANTPCDPSQSGQFEEYEVRGDSDSFFTTSNLGFQARATGYESSEEVWQAVARDPSLAVIDSNAIVGDFGTPRIIRGIDPGDTTFDPVQVVLLSPRTGERQTVTVIGVIEMRSSGTFMGLHVSEASLNGVFGQPDARRYYVQTESGADNREVARRIESSLLLTGAQAESLRQQIDEQGATINGFFYLMQGFMGLGLFVGVAAVGVISFRTVVERRQQIGMLRALGYRRGMIGLTFLIESSFIAFMGVVSGLVFALILARQLITDEFANQGVGGFAIPWIQISVIGGLAFGFALLMTLIPSRQAASIPIAEALRYE
jgi:putative ABC transport system permease protein